MGRFRRILIGTAFLALGLAPGYERAAQAAPDGERKFGLIPSTKEELLGIPLASTPYSGTELPKSVDLSPNLPPPLDQGNQNSCVGWALAYAVKTFQEKVEERQPLLTPEGRIDGNRVFSPGYVYSQVNNGRDGGCKYPDALRIVAEHGAAPWSAMPYDAAKPYEQPSAAAHAAARRYRIDYWRQVNVQDARELKAHLNGGYPVMIGARVDEGFKNLGNTVWSAASGAVLGNHAMVVVGYDDAASAFKLINSWGPSWGQGGYCWVSSQHFLKVVNEGYVAKDARNGPAPAVEPPPDPQPDVPPVFEPLPEPTWPTS